MPIFNGTLVHAVSLESEDNFYFGLFIPDGFGGYTIRVGLRSLGVDTVLNEITVDIAAKIFRTTVNIDTGLVEAEIEDADGLKESCVGPYNFNFGTRVGFFKTGPTSQITIDNFKYCENQCAKGCIYFVDELERGNAVIVPPDDPKQLLGDKWHVKDGNVSIATVFDSFGRPNGAMYFPASGAAYCKEPHPDGHYTMGVACRAQAWADDTAAPFTCQPFNNGKFQIRVCVDDPEDPQTWVQAEFNLATGEIEIASVQGGNKEVLATTGGGPMPQCWQELDYYVCVTNTGHVRACAKNIGGGYIAWYVYLETPASISSRLTGRYFGYQASLATVTDHIQRFAIEIAVAQKTYHPGDPEVWELEIGGTVEIGDLFRVTVDGETAEYAATETHIPNVVNSLAIFLSSLDVDTFPKIKALIWRQAEQATPNIFTGEIQGNVVLTVTTSEGPPIGGDADDQTFTASKTQSWVKGAYECPKCPERCSPCSYCIGDALDGHNEPDQVEITMEGVKIPPHPIALDGCGSYRNPNNVNVPVNNYGPPWAGSPDYRIQPCEDDLEGALAYNDTWLLDGCECGYSFWFPAWFEYYYPFPDDPDGVSGNPLNIGQFNPRLSDPVYDSCHPGPLCNGFIVTAQLLKWFGGADPENGWIYWRVQIEGDETTLLITLESERFPPDVPDECRKPRTIFVVDTPPPSDAYIWPATAQLRPFPPAP